MSLPVNITPAEGESLESVLERTAAANDITPATLLNLLQAKGGTRRRLTLTPSPETLRHLTDVTGIPAEVLRAATLEALDPERRLRPLTSGDRYTHRSVLASGWIRLHGTQLCPACISQSPTWRVRWRIPLVTACPDHHVYLVHECPSCKRPFRDRKALRTASRHGPF